MIPGTRPGHAPSAHGKPGGWHPYHWRSDSCCCNPGRRAELEAHDAYIAALSAQPDPDRINCSPATPEQKAAFYAARGEGLPIYKAAEAAGVSTKTASKWNKELRQQKEGAAA